MSKISVVIVTFNPNISLLEKIIYNLRTFDIFISDNCSDNVKNIKQLVNNMPNINLILNEQNNGIATAQNECLHKILSLKNHEFVFFLDQDSLITEKSLRQLYSDFMKTNEGRLAILSAVNSNQLNIGTNNIVKVKQCISSGMLVSVDAIRKVGFMMDSLFIDMVDYEWCWRFNKSGWYVAVDNNVHFTHQIGNHKLVLNRIEISPFRLYYVFRNTLFLILNGKTLNKEHNLFWINYLCKLFIFNIVFCDERRKRFLFINKGIMDGIKGKLGKLTNNY